MSLVARDVVVKRCSRVVLHGVGFHLPSGSHTVVVGGNGTGKTSLLRVLSGEMRPASGSVLMKGVSVSTVPPAALARHRVFLAQQTECRLPFLARDVVRFGAEARGLRGIAANRAADRAMHLANVAALASRPNSNASTGRGCSLNSTGIGRGRIYSWTNRCRHWISDTNTNSLRLSKPSADPAQLR